MKLFVKRGKEREEEKREEAQGTRDHGNKVLTQKRLKVHVYTGESTCIWDTTHQIYAMVASFLVTAHSLFPLFLGIFFSYIV